MMCRELERPLVRIGIGARHLELHDARVGETEMSRRMLGHIAERFLEHLTGLENPFAFERFERCAPFDEGAMRRQELTETLVAFTRRRSSDLDAEAISTTWNGLDVGTAARVLTERSSQAGDCLLDTVVTDRDILPSSLDQVVFGDDVTGPRHQEE